MRWKLRPSRRGSYTTVLAVLRRLEEKGYVGHEEEGRAHRYHPLVKCQQVRESALERLKRGLFQGSPELLLTHLVSRKRLSESDLRRLRELVDDQLEEDR